MTEKNGTDMNMTDNVTQQSSAENAKDAQKNFELEKAKFLIETANRFRLVFLFVAFLVLLFIVLGVKLWEDSTWFEKVSKNIFGFLYVDLGFMLIATFIKFFFVSKYNRIVKKL